MGFGEVEVRSGVVLVFYGESEFCRGSVRKIGAIGYFFNFYFCFDSIIQKKKQQ